MGRAYGHLFRGTYEISVGKGIKIQELPEQPTYIHAAASDYS